MTNDSLIEIFELHPSEMKLLNQLRTRFKYGEVTIIIRDGLPFRLRRVMDFVDLYEDKKKS